MITENSTNLYHTIDAPEEEEEDDDPKEGNKSNVVCTDWCCSISAGDTKDKDVGGVCSIPGADTVSVSLLLL